MPGPVSDSYGGPRDRADAPYVPSWMLDPPGPRRGACGHHEGYFNDGGVCKACGHVEDVFRAQIPLESASSGGKE
jgi:hypothetical protein